MYLNSIFSKNRDFIKINDAILKLLNGILIALIIILIYLPVEGFSFTPMPPIQFLFNPLML